MTRATPHGDPLAAEALARYYSEGFDLPVDMIEAFAWAQVTHTDRPEAGPWANRIAVAVTS